MVDRIRYPTVSYLPFYYVFFQFLLLTIFNLQANILTTKDILSNLACPHLLQICLQTAGRVPSCCPRIASSKSCMSARDPRGVMHARRTGHTDPSRLALFRAHHWLLALNLDGPWHTWWRCRASLSNNGQTKTRANKQSFLSTVRLDLKYSEELKDKCKSLVRKFR